ncbi:hypothetical protein OV090_26025 [Nannocystis sp. RBIL2]|uniref:hypothetical protein n=1 Tax=Nannocystis sp. RBIL2 TaxID=2996788 RepID=UPI00226E4266|nr:hypothetical protein [Nannocystis sp. RBIL2]MCY1068227.1 hypothetical protein [Nannocystis sp. RBIL2]
MSRGPSIVLLLAACAGSPEAPGASASDGSTAALTITGSTSTTGTSAEPTTSTSSSDGTTGSNPFIHAPDGGGMKECDLFAQDCPAGKKCAPHSADGDNSWETLKCVDVVPNPAGVGEPCEVFGPIASGEDTCDVGVMCQFIDWDTSTGTCVAHCAASPGSSDEPLCAPGSFCAITGDGVLNLCLPTCDPLAQDCPNALLCLHDKYDERWVCALDASGDEGQAFDPCVHRDACDPGLHCAEPEFAVECDAMASGCCLPLCDLDLPNTCPGQGQECVAWYPPGYAPPGLEQVGQCALP